jgi:GNAT superfamily N-acetyltransferase
VDPRLWNRGIAQLLMEPILECFARWGTAHAGLFTFAQSQKHVGLYQKFGFWPRFLTAILSKPVRSAGAHSDWTRFSEIPEADRKTTLEAARRLTGGVYEGLDVSLEILAVATQQLGDSVLLWDDAGLAGLAICHCGPGSEAGSGSCYVKFGAVRSSPTAATLFADLLDACEDLASQRGMARLIAGVNTARCEAYRQLLERGFRTDLQGVAMQRPDEPGYNRPGIYLIDDWR